MSHRDNSTEESSRRKHSKWGGSTFFAGGLLKGPTGSSGGGGRGGNDLPDNRKPQHDPNKIKKKNEKEEKYERQAHQDIQNFILNEINDVRPRLPGVFANSAHFEAFLSLTKDLSGTKALLRNVFTEFEQYHKNLSGNPSSELAIIQNPGDTNTLVDTEDGGSTYLHNASNATFEEPQDAQNNTEDLNSLVQAAMNANSDHGMNRGRTDSSQVATYSNTGLNRTYRRTVDVSTPRELENMKRKIEQLKGDNDRLLQDLGNAKGKIRDLEVENSRAVDWAVKSTIEQERRTAQNERVALKRELETVIEKDFRKKIKDLQDKVTYERQNVVKETAQREKHQREYRLSREKLEQKHGEEINDMKVAHSSETQWHLKEFNQKLSDGERFHEAQMHQLEKQQATILADAYHQFDLQRKEWEQAKSDLAYNHQKDKHELQERHKEDLASEKDKLLTTIYQLKDKNKAAWAKHDEEISDLRSKHSNELEQLNSQVVEQRQAFDTERAQLLDEFDKKEARWTKEAEDTEARRKKEYQQKFEDIGEKHEKDKVQLRKDRDAYSAALLERDKVRDKIEFLSDVQITKKWDDLVAEVEQLARLEWKRGPELEGLVKSLSVQPDTLKRHHLLQDTIWLILHEFIFCSPFRIFGEEGKRLEAQWFEQSGKGAFVSLNQYGRFLRA